MKNTCRRAGFLPCGEVDRRGIEKTAHTVMAPLVAAVGSAVHPPALARAWLRHTITALYNMGHASQFMDALKLLYALAGLDVLPNIELLVRHPVAASYFMLACLSAVEELTEKGNLVAVD